MRLRWEDDCAGPTIFYDDHICLECGLYTNSGCSLCKESLQEYRRKYGHLVGRYEDQKDPKRFFNLLWASMWRLMTSTPLGRDLRYLKISLRKKGTQ